MKKYFLISMAAVFLAACSGKQETLVEETLFNSYGEVISEDGALALAVLDKKLDGVDSVEVKLKATIDKTCEKKGCWMTVTDDEGNEVRVTFKDYGFFVPTEGAEGKEVVISGYAYRKTTELDMLKHFAEDAGKSQEEIDAITEPKVEITFVANGVIIFEKEEKQGE
jgi:hypothetical protein